MCCTLVFFFFFGPQSEVSLLRPYNLFASSTNFLNSPRPDTFVGGRAYGVCSFSRSSSRSSVSVNFSLPPEPVVFCPARLAQFLIFAHRSKAIGNQLPIAGKYFPFLISFLFLHFYLPFISIYFFPQTIRPPPPPPPPLLRLPSLYAPPDITPQPLLLSAIFPLFSLNPPLALNLPPPPPITCHLPFSPLFSLVKTPPLSFPYAIMSLLTLRLS